VAPSLPIILKWGHHSQSYSNNASNHPDGDSHLPAGNSCIFGDWFWAVHFYAERYFSPITDEGDYNLQVKMVEE
jgi:hypothetical protein